MNTRFLQILSVFLCVLLFAGVAHSKKKYKKVEAPPGAGLAAMHDWQKERRKICMASHFHYGSGSHENKKESQRLAIKSWRDYTALEYGDEWGVFKYAGSKSLKCMESVGTWECSAEGRPCKRYKRKRRRARRKKKK